METGSVGTFRLALFDEIQAGDIAGRLGINIKVIQKKEVKHEFGRTNK